MDLMSKAVMSRRTLVCHWEDNEIKIDGTGDVAEDVREMLEEAAKQYMNGVKRGGRRKVYLDVRVQQLQSGLEPSLLKLQIVIKRNTNFSDYEFI
jgi:hypothetical protein